MADNTNSYRIDTTDLSEDDPFAELTRIMGHDPRNAQEQEAAQMAASSDLALELELENELLGDFADFQADLATESAGSNAQGAPASEERQAYWPAANADWRAEEPQAVAEEPQDIALDLSDELDASFNEAFSDAMMPEADASKPEAAQASVHDFQSEMPSIASEPAFGAPSDDETPVDFSEKSDVPADEAHWAAFDAEFNDALHNTMSVGADETTASGEAVMPAGPVHDYLDHDYPGEDASVRAVEAVAEEMQHAPQDDFADFAPDMQAEPQSDAGKLIFDPATARNLAQPVEAPVPEAPEEVEFPPEFFQQTEVVVEQALVDEPEDAPGPAYDADDVAAEVYGVSPAQADTAETSADIPVESDPAAGWDAQMGSPAEHQWVPQGLEAHDAMPVIETVEVPDSGIAVEDAQHIPELAREPENKVSQFDDLEAVLANAFGDAETAPTTVQPRQETYAAPVSAPEYTQKTETENSRDELGGFDFDDVFTDKSAGGSANLPDWDDGTHGAGYAAPEAAAWNEQGDEKHGAGTGAILAGQALNGQWRNRRNLAIAGAIGGVALLGAVGMFAFSPGGGDDAGPALVRADDSPVKVKPENPGGTQVPNQDNQVYQRVSGDSGNARPAQEQLVSTREEPVEVAPPPVRQAEAPATENNASSVQDIVRSDERLTSGTETAGAANTNPIATVTPRRVRTMVVRPDGTMVPSEAPAPQPAAPTATTANQEQVAAVGERAAAVPQQAPIPSSRPSTSAQPRQPAAPAQNTQQIAARTEPVRNEPVAPATPTQPAVAPAASGWSVQIASQPTVESAQQSYRALADRYGNVLAGKGVNIVKADIAGKGTYYRVRIPSSSKDDAIRLCSQLKSAGGSCFVSK